MPFITPQSSLPDSTIFYQIRSVTSHLGTSTLIQKKALQLVHQQKKVLIIDALLGLKNIPINNKNDAKLSDFFKGLIPLSDLIISYKGADVITGIAHQNINALPAWQRKKLQQDLQLLALNYDVVLIDMPYHITHPLFEDLGQTYWVVSLDKKILLDTLKAAHTSEPYLILNEKTSAVQFNDFILFLKLLAPKCHLETHFV